LWVLSHCQQLYLFVSSLHKLAQTLQYITSLIIYKKEELAVQLDYDDTTEQ